MGTSRRPKSAKCMAATSSARCCEGFASRAAIREADTAAEVVAELGGKDHAALVVELGSVRAQQHVPLTPTLRPAPPG